MPITIPHNLPAKEVLEQENIFVMDEHRAYTQDIRPLNIIILNIMPEKEKTEAQLLRLLGNSPLQVNITLVHPDSHQSKTTKKRHLEQFYTTFEKVKHKRFDGMIITGAPIEHLPFEEVTYWNELKEIMEWTKSNVTSTLHICWGAQAGLYFHYGVNKYPVSKKIFGVFQHRILERHVKLLRGFDDLYQVPQSRITDIRIEEVKKISELSILSISEKAGVCLVATKDGRQIFLTGHPEYDATTLKEEYDRDVEKGLSVDVPENYFHNNNPNETPIQTWRSHATLLFANWLNYYVYQETPYEWE